MQNPRGNAKVNAHENIRRKYRDCIVHVLDTRELHMPYIAITYK